MISVSLNIIFLCVQIIFEARLAGGSEGDIAIDDISIHAGQCETQ